MKSNDLTVCISDGLLNVRVGAIIRKDNKILMVSNERADYYYSVGGRVKFGETAEEAVKREVYEETGVRLEVNRLGFVHENFFFCDCGVHNGKPVYEISFFFYMDTPDDFEPKCNSISENEQREHLNWIELDSDKKFYPEFFRTELTNIGNSVKHIVTR